MDREGARGLDKETKRKMEDQLCNFVPLGAAALAGGGSERRRRQAGDVCFSVLDSLLFGPQAAALCRYV